MNVALFSLIESVHKELAPNEVGNFWHSQLEIRWDFDLLTPQDDETLVRVFAQLITERVTTEFTILWSAGEASVRSAWAKVRKEESGTIRGYDETEQEMDHPRAGLLMRIMDFPQLVDKWLVWLAREPE